MKTDVVIIGAGPAGSVAAAMLANAGLSVLVLERSHFPRFSIGESLLPQAMEWLEEAGLLRDVVEAGFQHKNGAIFRWGGREERFDFRLKFSEGWGTTYQVRRDRFDDLLARGAARMGARILFGHTVVAMTPDPDAPQLTARDEHGVEFEITSRFVLDASGFGRVLARLLKLETAVPVPARMSIFAHFVDKIPPEAHDRNKILISVNPQDSDIWYWLIPLADGICSTGVVGPLEKIKSYGSDNETRLNTLIEQSGRMGELLAHASPAREADSISGYTCGVSSLTGPGYALLGNAGEFLDPIFSSGVTIALKSANLAAKAVLRQFGGAGVDWDEEFEVPLGRGVETFRAYVDGWYDGELRKIIFTPTPDQNDVKLMVTSVMAGYAWDQSNPFVSMPKKYLGMVASLCN